MVNTMLTITSSYESFMHSFTPYPLFHYVLFLWSKYPTNSRDPVFYNMVVIEIGICDRQTLKRQSNVNKNARNFHLKYDKISMIIKVFIGFGSRKWVCLWYSAGARAWAWLYCARDVVRSGNKGNWYCQLVNLLLLSILWLYARGNVLAYSTFFFIV